MLGTVAAGEGVVIATAVSSVTVNTSVSFATGGTALNMSYSGGGTVTLSGNNNFGATGSTALNGGTTLILSTPTFTGTTYTGIGSGALLLNNGTLETTISGLILPNALTLGNSNATLGGNNIPLTFTGIPTASGAVVTLNIPGSGDSSLFTGSFAGAVFVTKAGSGTLTLTGTNVFTLLNVNAGTVVSGIGASATALGAATGSAVVASTAKIQIQQGTASTKPLVLNGGTGLQWFGGGTGVAASSGTILLQTNTTIDVAAGSLALSGVISGPGSLTKTSNGYLSMAPATGNLYFGGTTVSGGILEFTGVAAGSQFLGQIVSGVTVASGATLSLNPSTASTVSGYSLTISGTGFGSLASGNLLLARGALVNNVGATNIANTWTGNINLVGDTTISSFPNAANALTVTGIVSGSASLTKVGAGTLVLQAPSTFTNNVTVSAGTLTLQGANAYTGATTVGTTAGLTLNLLGSILNTSGITVNTGATLTIDNNTSAYVATRIATGTTVNLNGGNLTYVANNNIGFNTSATLGTVNLTGGNSTITAGTNAAAAAGVVSTLTIGTLNRTGVDTTVTFAGSNMTLGSPYNQLIINNLGTNAAATSVTNGSILPYSTLTSPAGTVDFASSVSNSIQAFTGYVTSLAASTSVHDVVKETVTEAMTANKTIAGLVLSNGVTVNQNGFTLTVGNGTLARRCWRSERPVQPSPTRSPAARWR